jgi:hypothetical protein
MNEPITPTPEQAERILAGITQAAAAIARAYRVVTLCLRQRQAPQEIGESLLAASQAYRDAVQRLAERPASHDITLWFPLLDDIDEAIQTCRQVCDTTMAWFEEQDHLLLDC